MITSYAYNGKKILKYDDIPKVGKFVCKKGCCLWIDLEDASDEDYKKLKETFGFHPLAIEDCKADIILPKIDDYDNYIFLVFHRIVQHPQTGHIAVQEMDFFLGENYLISVHKQRSTSVEKMRAKIEARPNFMENGPDFVMYGIIDLFMDKYFPIIRKWTDDIELVEERIVEKKTQKVMPEIINMKRNILTFKNSIAPQRDIIGKLARGDIRFISRKAMRYYRDLYDNLMWVYTNVESSRDLLSNAFDAYSSTILNTEIETSNRLNVMIQRLTVISTIFLPLTFIASFYGMNFHNMPELSWKYGYAGVIIIMLVIAAVMAIFFRSKGWLRFRGN